MAKRTKTVKFDFFQVFLDEKVYKFEDWIKTLGEQIDANYDSVVKTTKDDKFAAYQIGKVGEYETVHFVKYRLDVPTVGKLEKDQPLTELQLNDDEFVIEDFSILYDKKNRVLMIQRNVYSANPTFLSKYVDTIRDDDRTTEFCPIISAAQYAKRPKDGVIKKINIKTADIRQVGNETLRGIFKSQNIPDGLNVEITISTGRERNKYIKNEFADEIINNVKNDSSGLVNADITAAKVTRNRNKNKEMVYDTEFVDLLEGRIRAEHIFDLGDRRATILSAEEVQNKMYQIYEKYKQRILANIEVENYEE